MITQEQARWTPDQQRAIEESGTTLLVSAAAGSGKTSVLVERIISRLTRTDDPFDVDEFLVVTFTDAAAAQMRRRIADAIVAALHHRPDDAHLRKQLALLPRAAISTLHAFCKRVLRRYFDRSDIDPGFTVLGQHEALLIQDDVLDAILERRYTAQEAAAPGGFLDLVDRYGGEHGDRDLRRLVLALYHHSRSLPYPECWLEEVAGAFADPGDLARWLRPAWQDALGRARRSERLLARAVRLSRQPGGPAWLAPILEQEAAIASRVREALEAAEPASVPSSERLAALRQALEAVTFADLRGGRRAAREGDDAAVREQVLGWRKQARDALLGLRDTPLGSEAAADRAREDLRNLAPAMAQLCDLVREFAAGFRESKRRRNAVDFADLEHLTLELLRDPEAARQGRGVPSEVAEDLRARFREILVDEYQDTNPVQEALLSLIARPDGERPGEFSNLFLVGDVKQSIYRFRMADPSLFLRRLATYPDRGPGPHRIDLQANFRSRQGVVDAVNFLFRRIMTPEVGELAYDARAELVCWASYRGDDPPVELHVVGSPEDDVRASAGTGGEADAGPSSGSADWPDPDPSSGSAGSAGPGALPISGDASGSASRLEREAAAVAARLARLFEEGAIVHDHKAGPRPLRPSDVVILLRAANADAPVFAEALANAGIPVHAQAGTGYFGAIEVVSMLALLDVIDNPRQDIPLAAVLRSPIVGLDAADLARIRLARPAAEFYEAVVAYAPQDERVAGFLARLDSWRTAARRGPLSDLVWRLLSETGFLAFSSGLPGGPRRRANLLALHDRAREFDQFTRQGLFRFLRFIRRLQEAGEDLGMASAAGESADVVRIMSIHRSKGLEFPVVVVAGLGKRWNVGDLQGDVLLDREIGLGPRVVDPIRRIKYPSLAHQVVRERARRQLLAEEMRILYVALTRARERLILFGSIAKTFATGTRASRGPDAPAGLMDSTGTTGGRGTMDATGSTDTTAGMGTASATGSTESSHFPASPDTTGFAREELMRLWAERAGAEGTEGPLPQDAVAGASCPLDWIGMALAGGPSDWEVHVWPGQLRPADSGLSTPPAAAIGAIAAAGPDPASRPEAVGDPDPMEGRPDVTPHERPHAPAAAARFDDLPPAAREVVARLSWRYPFEALARCPAKIAASKALAALPPDDPDLAPSPQALRPVLLGRPRFVQTDARKLTAAERGTATHLLMQHLDFEADRTLEALGARLQDMISREIVTPEAAAAIDREAILAFLESPLGRQLAAADAASDAHVLREIPFSVQLPVREIDPTLPPDLAESEWVLLQGMIDCLLQEADGLTILDYKTDSPEGRPLDQLAAEHRQQMQRYRAAATAMFGMPVKAAHLVFLAARQVVSL